MTQNFESIDDFLKNHSSNPDWSDIETNGRNIFFKKDELKGKYNDKDFGEFREYLKGNDINYDRNNIDDIYYEDLGIKVSKDELASFLWFSIFHTNAIKNIFFKLGLPLNREEFIIHLVSSPNSHGYSLLVFHKRLKKEILPIEIFKGTKDRILSELFPNVGYSDRIEMSNSSLQFRNQFLFNLKGNRIFSALTKDRMKFILDSLDFEIFVIRYPKMQLLSNHPNISFGVGEQLNKKSSSAGIFTSNQSGKFGCTTCYHDFMNSPSFGIGSKLFVNNNPVTVESIHIPSDSCFVSFDNQNISQNQLTQNNGPLINVSPRMNDPVQFTGITSGTTNTIVKGWDPTIPFIKPNVNIINQQKVITNPSSQPGDSGSALIDNNNNVIGFATYRTGVNAVVPFSVWVWAEEIYYHHNL